MKASILFGATLAVVSAAVVSILAETQSALPAATASPRPTAALSASHATATPSPYASASPTTRGPATGSSSTKGEHGARATPEITPSPSGGAQLEGESPHSVKRESSPKRATPAATTKPTPSRPHRKLERREANIPPPDDGSGEQH